jgi:hypothetical protein
MPMATNNAFNMALDVSSNHEIIMQKQACFIAYPSIDQYTAIGTTAGKLQFNTALVNIGTYYSTQNHNFIAPVAGRYCIGINATIYNIVAGNTGLLFYIKTTTRTYRPLYCSPAKLRTASNELTVGFNTVCNLAANQVVTIEASGTNAAMGLRGGADKTLFYGYLIC